MPAAGKIGSAAAVATTVWIVIQRSRCVPVKYSPISAVDSTSTPIRAMPTNKRLTKIIVKSLTASGTAPNRANKAQNRINGVRYPYRSPIDPMTGDSSAAPRPGAGISAGTQRLALGTSLNTTIRVGRIGATAATAIAGRIDPNIRLMPRGMPAPPASPECFIVILSSSPLIGGALARGSVPAGPPAVSPATTGSIRGQAVVSRRFGGAASALPRLRHVRRKDEMAERMKWPKG